MKKLLLMIAMVAVGLTANAQKTGFNLGADVTYNFNAEAFGLMAEANYLFEVSDEFKLGPAISYQHTFSSDKVGNTVGGALGSIVNQLADNLGVNTSSSVFTIAAAGRFDASEEFVLGADLGFATNSGGFYYRPLVGYRLGESSMIQLSYPGYTGGGALALGVMFGL